MIWMVIEVHFFRLLLEVFSKVCPRGKRGIHFNTEKLIDNDCKVQYIYCVYMLKPCLSPIAK